MTRRQTTQTTTETRERSANQLHADFASCEAQDGVAFSKGNMIVNGQPQLPVETQDWESSNGTTVYTAVKWQDPATGEHRVSCNCPGWAHKKAGQLRQCKHTLDMMGLKPCTDEKHGRPTTIRSTAQAEQEVPRFDGQALRGLDLDWDNLQS